MLIDIGMTLYFNIMSIKNRKGFRAFMQILMQIDLLLTPMIG